MSENTDHNFDPRWHGWCVKKHTWHFHRQLHARYGIVMEFGEFAEMLRDIRSGRAELIERKYGKRAIYAVLLTRCWRRIFIVVDGHHILTALPPTPHLRRKWRRFYRS
jgi:hypothetical protein